MDSFAGPQKGFSVVHSFSFVFAGAGTNPTGVTVDSVGNLLGVTDGANAVDGAVLFKLTPIKGAYVEQVLHSFSCSFDGCVPEGAPAIDPSSGNVFATTAQGAANNVGSFVEFSPDGPIYNESGLFPFTRQSGDQAFSTPLIQGQRAYVTTCCDGPKGANGSIITFTTSGLQVVSVFTLPDGKPYWSLVSDATGVLFGAAVPSGSTGGYVYRYLPNTSGANGGTSSVVFAFTGGSSGSYPAGPVLLGASGTIYGVTSGGGTSGYGVIYKLTPTASGYTETVLHSFTGPPDGAYPDDVGLVSDGKFLWGTTTQGGDKSCNCGTLFSISTSGTQYLIRHTFSYTDGSSPSGSLATYKGDIYGVAGLGGPSGVGVVYRYKP
jgi:uncharacterized repeat protein (TIGR03803 family)